MVFSLSVAGEYMRKPFTGLKSAATSVALINQCINHTEAIVKESGLEVLWFDEHLQKGRNFAERYKNAVKSCFERGYERVISIGNDAPELTATAIQSASEKLRQNDLVIGPSADGGIYLLGLNKKAFDEDQFLGFPWQQDSLNQAIVLAAASKGQRVSVLEQLIDLDDLESVTCYVSSYPDSGISKLILKFSAGVAEKVTPLPFYIIVLPKVHVATNPFRGPPVVHI